MGREDKFLGCHGSKVRNWTNVSLVFSMIALLYVGHKKMMKLLQLLMRDPFILKLLNSMYLKILQIRTMK
jgi:hypothetical protein